jgi:hypothetical protein
MHSVCSVSIIYSNPCNNELHSWPRSPSQVAQLVTNFAAIYGIEVFFSCSEKSLVPLLNHEPVNTVFNIHSVIYTGLSKCPPFQISGKNRVRICRPYTLYCVEGCDMLLYSKTKFIIYYIIIYLFIIIIIIYLRVRIEIEVPPPTDGHRRLFSLD